MLKNIFPLLIVKEIKKETEFFVNILDFKVIFDSDWYVQLDLDGNQLAIMTENSSNQPKFLQKAFDEKGIVITLEYSNIDEVYNSIKDKVNLLQDIKTEEWGQRHFIVSTPGNVVVDLVNYTSPEDYK